MCLIGNKVDLREERPEGSCVTSVHGEKLAMVRKPWTSSRCCKVSSAEGFDSLIS